MPVLVVDDNATSRRILREMFTNWGMNPATADSGQAALESMEAASKSGQIFPLVLVDGCMPGMDGFELSERIHENPALSGTTIIMLTSAGQRGDAARCAKANISGYLLKPVKQSELFDTIVRTLVSTTTDEAKAPLITRHVLRASRRGLHILLAEDNAVNQKLAVALLQKMGHTVSVAQNGKEVLAAHENPEFQLILMDVQMPEMDGLSATRAIREREKMTGAHVPIIAMTAHAMKGDRERCLEAGMDGYVSKPINPDELFDAIEEVAEGMSRSQGPPPEAGGGPAVLDYETLLNRVGGDTDLLREVVDIFLDEYATMLSQVRNAIEDRNAEALQKTAHTLKGAVGNFAAHSVFEAALKLENMGRSGDITGSEAAFLELEGGMERLREALVSLREETGR